jgi:hypothetical protein
VVVKWARDLDAATIDDEKAIRLHLAVRSRKFLDAKHLVENDNASAQNARHSVATLDERPDHCCPSSTKLRMIWCATGGAVVKLWWG